jgi:putative flippase GtrA
MKAEMAKACADNALAGIQLRTKTVASRQADERNEVAASRQRKNSSESADFPPTPGSKPSSSKVMRTGATGIPPSISRKPLPVNELRRSGCVENEKNIREKRASTNAGGTLLRWWRFNLVGGMGIVVQLAALFLLKSIFHFNYLAATAVAVEAAVVHNFVWHEQFTWADRVQPAWCTSLPRFARFNLTAGGVSIAGNLALMKVMVGLGHINYFAANAIAIALCSGVNFLVSDGWVFDE